MSFDHLPLPQRIDSGKYNSPYGKRGNLTVRIDPSEQTVLNRENRAEHGANLKNKSQRILTEWVADFTEREESSLPSIPEAIPLFVQVDPKIFSADSLKSFGIEVISEESEGYIIGASAELNLSTLQDKIEKFIAEEGKFKNTASQLWDIVEGKEWRLENILSKDLYDKWDALEEDNLILVDIAIACFVQTPGSFPERRLKDEENDIEEETEESYNLRIEKWEEKVRKVDEEWDELSFNRQNELERFILAYSGEIISSYVNSVDSFSCRVKISVKGLKDLLLNYPYLFEVEEYDDIRQDKGNLNIEVEGNDVEIIEPDENAPKVCVIDSGIQEGHNLISPALLTAHSFSYVPNEAMITSDQVDEGGHGTRVAGAVLYPDFPNFGTTFKLKSWIQNARVLNADNALDEKLYPPDLIRSIVSDYSSLGTRIYNHSITRKSGFLRVRMSKWAESIDRQIWNEDILFILAAGNLRDSTLDNRRPGILEFLRENLDYPKYLLDKRSRVADPAQGLFGLTVGSICHSNYEDEDLSSFGKEDFPSSFSRSGLGIWGAIKPEVVEYGGDFVYEKEQDYPNIVLKEQTSLNLLRSTFHGGPSNSPDGIGTSYTAPKVASIISHLQGLFPDESSLLYKTLLVQSARWPEIVFSKPATLNFLRLYGYGVPDLVRATSNTDYRITLVSSSTISPKLVDVYEVKIPEQLRRLGDNYDILVEVTMCFKANPRRTRTGFNNYVSGWLDWHSSKLGESIEDFKERVVFIDEEDLRTPEEVDQQPEMIKIPWTIGSRANAGISGVKLNNSATQKDWAVLKSNQLTQSFCIGVVAHQGWEKDLRHELPYSIAISFEAINKDIEIYNDIRVENEIEIEVTT